MFRMREYEPPKRVQVAIKNLFIIMAYFMIVTLFLAIAYYPEKYQFFYEHISNLGGFNSSLGALNSDSMIIMMIGFGLCGLLVLTVGILYFVNRDLHLWLPKGILSVLLAVGAAGIAIPLDHSLRLLHLAGAGIFIGGFAAFNALLQISSLLKKRKDKVADVNKLDTIWDITLSAIVIIILLGYFTIFALDWLAVGPINLGPMFQKAVVFAEILALYFIDNKDV
ncbi:MAG: hypothetical protein H7645_11390 [Candidatus Heimdallarchaeota archaeon]|nr:hypothetical protein [Candidatus Heimdallarchaeota archaeon]MCK4770928.1 hypothetical protein [Candidatus Heimdallarchaeota archaeon]